MIEIIKEGEPNWYTCTCPECKTEFRYTKNELHQDWSKHNYGITSAGIYGPMAIYCPVCHFDISI